MPAASTQPLPHSERERPYNGQDRMVIILLPPTSKKGEGYAPVCIYSQEDLKNDQSFFTSNLIRERKKEKIRNSRFLSHRRNVTA